MSMDTTRKAELEAKCLQFRRDVLTVIHKIQSGHTGGSFSVCEILAALYLEKANISPENWGDPARDRIILSKGHAAPMLYRLLAEKGFFPLSDLENLRQFGSHLQGHPCSRHTPGVELSTGPLGMGLSAGLGMALSNRLDGYDDTYVYVILGDGEINEGCIWEAAMSASKFKADHLIAILDNNKVQLDGTNDEIMPMGDLKAKWEAFGFYVIKVDGHDVEALCDAVDEAKAHKGSPVLILADTVKGKGVSFMEGKNIYHGKPITDDEYTRAMAELGGA